MKRKSLLLVAVFGMAILATSINFGNRASATTTGTNSFLVPSASSNTTAPNDATQVTALSADGKYAVVNTNSNNSILGSASNTSLLLNIGNQIASKFVESTAGIVGSPYTNIGGLGRAAISETGRYVAFLSEDTNLIDGTTISGGNMQLYLRDTQAGITTLLSKDSSGNPANSSIGEVYGVSEDGRFVLFETNATNLVSSASGYNIYMLDRSTGTFSVVNLDYGH